MDKQDRLRAEMTTFLKNLNPAVIILRREALNIKNNDIISG